MDKYQTKPRVGELWKAANKPFPGSRLLLIMGVEEMGTEHPEDYLYAAVEIDAAADIEKPGADEKRVIIYTHNLMKNPYPANVTQLVVDRSGIYPDLKRDTLGEILSTLEPVHYERVLREMTALDNLEEEEAAEDTSYRVTPEDLNYHLPPVLTVLTNPEAVKEMSNIITQGSNVITEILPKVLEDGVLEVIVTQTADDVVKVIESCSQLIADTASIAAGLKKSGNYLKDYSKKFVKKHPETLANAAVAHLSLLSSIKELKTLFKAAEDEIEIAKKKSEKAAKKNSN